jgi:hypothetical protein
MSINLCGTDQQGCYGHRSGQKIILAQNELEMRG